MKQHTSVYVTVTFRVSLHVTRDRSHPEAALVQGQGPVRGRLEGKQHHLLTHGVPHPRRRPNVISVRATPEH